MADILDVQNAIVALITQAVYPNGTGNAPAQGVPVAALPGWPAPMALDSLMAAGTSCVWVYCRPEVKDVTRYPPTWLTQSIAAPTITAVVSGRTVTIGGVMPSPFSPHNIFVMMDGVPFSYSVQSGDTLTSIATALAAVIHAAYPATTSSGPVITIPTGPIPVARVGTVGTSIQELGRFEQSLQIVMASKTPVNRSTLAAAIMPVLMANPFLTMPDGTACRLRVRVPIDMDSDSKLQIFRRDIRVTAEYAVTQVQTTATVESVSTTFSDIYASSVPPRSF